MGVEPLCFCNRLNDIPDCLKAFSVDDLDRGALAEVANIETRIYFSVSGRRQNMVCARCIIAAGDRGVCTDKD